MNANLFERVLKTIRHYEMLNPGDSVLAAVSGGPDSMFMLHAICRLKSKLSLKGVAVANLDHGLRGRVSREDSDFVKKAATGLGLEFFHKKIELKKEKHPGLSTEELAREKRYAFLAKSASKIGANVIATGHTLDDHAETILMRLIRGSSLKGIIGIPPVREEKGLRIVRPLLELGKEEIKKYLDESGVAYRVDHTNFEPIYFRNIVRKEIIPFLEKYNPRLKRALVNLSEHLREDFEFIEDAKRKALLQLKPSNRGILKIKLKDLVVQPKSLQKEILRDALNLVGGEVKRLTYRHWKEMEYFIKYKRRGDSLHLPGGVGIKRTDESLDFQKL